MVIRANVNAPLKGLVPHGYTGVFEPHYTDDSAIGFAWTITHAEQGSIYVKVANPSKEDVVLYGGMRI